MYIKKTEDTNPRFFFIVLICVCSIFYPKDANQIRSSLNQLDQIDSQRFKYSDSVSSRTVTVFALTSAIITFDFSGTAGRVGGGAIGVGVGVGPGSTGVGFVVAVDVSDEVGSTTGAGSVVDARVLFVAGVGVGSATTVGVGVGVGVVVGVGVAQGLTNIQAAQSKYPVKVTPTEE